MNKMRTTWVVVWFQHILRKAIFGKNLTVSCKLEIAGPGKTVIGDNCKIEPDPWGNEHVTFYTHRKKARILIGNNVTLRASRFGSHLNIQVNDDAVIEGASIYDSDFHNIDATKRDEDYNQNDREVIIRKGAYIGIEALCSKGTIIGEKAVVLPLSVIGTKAIPDASVAGGLPVKIINNP